jgi:hypothetical protein
VENILGVLVVLRRDVAGVDSLGKGISNRSPPLPANAWLERGYAPAAPPVGDLRDTRFKADSIRGAMILSGKYY